MSLQTVQAALEAKVAELVALEATYGYPVSDIGRALPALVVLYDGLEQERASHDSTLRTWSFEFTLYFPADGKRLDYPWDQLLAFVPTLLDAFQADPALGGAVWDSRIQSGEPIIHAPEAPGSVVRFVGHTFQFTGSEMV